MHEPISEILTPLPRDHAGGDGVVHKSGSEPAVGGGGALERAVQALLRIGGLPETEEAAATLLRRVSGAEWVSLYRDLGAGALTRTATVGVPQALCDGFPREELDALFGAKRLALRCPEGAPLRAQLPSDVEVIAPVELGEEGDLAAFLLGPRADGGVGYRPEDLATLSRMADWCGIALHNALLLEQLRSQAYLDALTECYNRRAMDEHLRVELQRSLRYQRPMSLLLLDIDSFKDINDELGHLAGDHALRCVGASLRAAFRTTDLVCRYGGDEFAIVLPETERADALQVAERVRVQIAALFPDGQVKHGITASVGIASFPTDAEEPEALLRAADHALYAAKTAGRDRVCRR